ncbi:MAG: N-acetyl-gamma-glutamyl-phosphate reductase [Bacteroidota bacterium]
MAKVANPNKKIQVGIVGGAGYTGGELIRLLINHPYVDIRFVLSKSNAGNLISKVHNDLIGETNLIFAENLDQDIDVLFLCVGHGDAKKLLAENSVASHIRIIDLSQDFRLNENNIISGRAFVYGLPELNKKEISNAQNIANPGCFATAIQLGLIPIAKAGLLTDVYTTGITGSTGAGQSLSTTSHFSWRANNISAYKTLHHQHLKEIGESLQQASGNNLNTKDLIHFVPWRGDFARGIYTSSVTKCEMGLDEVKKMYQDFYAGAAFTHISDTMIDLKQVVNTNKCLIHIEKQGDKIAIHTAIDNLIKGASGQAVQNMNILFGLNEVSGLRLKANYF